MKRYSYHYCALVGNSYWDGIVQMEEKILTFEDYTKLKQLIIDTFKEPYKANEVSIQSLSLLGYTESL